MAGRVIKRCMFQYTNKCLVLYILSIIKVNIKMYSLEEYNVKHCMIECTLHLYNTNHD